MVGLRRWRPTGMHPVFLYFSDPEVELGYVSHQAESFLAAMDGNFVALSFLLFGVAASCKAWQGELGLAKELAVAFLPVAMQGLLIRMGMWRKWRTPLAVTIRMIRTALFSGAAKEWVQPTRTGRSIFLKVILVQGGPLYHIWLSLGTPLLFRYHLFIQLFSVAYTFALAGRNMECAAFLQGDGMLFQEHWTNLNEILSVLAGGPFNHRSRVNASPSLLCSQMLSFAMLVLGYIVPSMVIFRIELVSRSCYIERMSGGSSTWRIVHGRLTDWAQISVLMLIGFSSLWTILLHLISAVQHSK